MSQSTLLSIPVETRLEILRLALSQVECHVFRCWSQFSPNRKITRLGFTDYASLKSDVAVLYTCKQLRTECLAILGSVVPLGVGNEHELELLCGLQPDLRNSYLKTVTQAKIFPGFSRSIATGWLMLLRDYTTIQTLNLVARDSPSVSLLKGVKVVDIETEAVKMAIESASIRIFKREKAKLRRFNQRQINLTMDLMFGERGFAPPAFWEVQWDIDIDYLLVSRIPAQEYIPNFALACGNP